MLKRHTSGKRATGVGVEPVAQGVHRKGFHREKGF